MPKKTPQTPFLQGSLDPFCAPYAVLNACRRLFGMRTKQAREWLNATLIELAQEPGRLAAYLTLEDDGTSIADALLDRARLAWPCTVAAPFASTSPVSIDTFKDQAIALLKKGDAMLIFRFEQHLSPASPALLRHWTAAYGFSETGLLLYDGGAGLPEPMTMLAWSELCLAKRDLSQDRLLLVRPASCRLLRRILP